MSISHLDVLHQQLPELFQDREVPESWHDTMELIRVDDPERQPIPSPVAFSDTILPIERDVTAEDVEAAIAESIVEEDPEEIESAELTLQVFGGAHSGSPLAPTGFEPELPPDCHAFYLPFHYYHPTWWGVYLLADGVRRLSRRLLQLSGRSIHPREAVTAARLFLYYHEAFHHKVECFATRLEITHRRPFYKTSFERLYQRVFMTDACLEEGLANAEALTATDRKLRAPLVLRALEQYVKGSPSGYCRGVEFRKPFVDIRCRFAEENQFESLPHLGSRSPEIWRATPQMFSGISNITSCVNYIVPRQSRIAARLPFRPLLTTRQLVRKLQDLVELEFVRHGGRHDVYRARGGRLVEIPRHPGDLGRGLIRSILREAGLDVGLAQFLAM